MTVKTRIMFFVAGAGMIFGLLYSAVVGYELIEQPFYILDSVMKEEAYEAAVIVSKMPMPPGHSQEYPALHTTGGVWMEIHDRISGKMLFRSPKAESIRLPVVKIMTRSGSVVRVALPPEEGGRGSRKGGEVAFRVKDFSFDINGRTYGVRVARDMEKVYEEIRDLLVGIFAGLIVSTLGLLAASRFLAGKILHPIGRMKMLAQEISEKNLDRRIPTGEERDELSELAGTINRMLDRLQYSFVRQREFLFDTSHELKTPLTTMRLAVDEISAFETENMPPYARENLLRLKCQLLRMERLIKDLLNLSSLESMTGIDPKPLRLSDLLSSLLEEYKFLADARGIRMDIRLPEGLVVKGDEEKLRRAFSNLLDNALKYNVEEGRVELTAEQAACGITVIVGNTGPGVPENEISKVFEQFYRAEESRSVESGGSGLGLAIVRRIVELHGGKAVFESRQGSWTRVTVSLPSNADTAIPA